MSRKTINITKRDESISSEKISLDVMREIWNDEGNNYSDIELMRMREFAYLVMETVIKNIKDRKKSYNLNSNFKSDESEESNIIYPSEYRRAS